MRDPAQYLISLRRRVRNREGLVAVAYLGALGLGIAIALPSPIRGPALAAIEGVIARVDGRWTSAVQRGERLVAEGRYEEAAVFLGDLDARFPARNVKHARDDERKRVLRALAEAEDSLGRKRATLAALGRLLEFDPRDYASHLQFAEAARRFGEDDAALEAYEAVLAIHPIELNSLRHTLQYRVDAGDFRGAAATFDRFVESLVLSSIELRLDSTRTIRHIHVDGRFHELQVDVEPRAGWSGEIRMETEGFAIEIDEVTVDPALRVGLPAPRSVVLRATDLPRSRERLIEARDDILQASAPHPALVLTVPSGVRDARRIRIRLRLLKLVDEDAWRLAETSYRNVLAFDRLADVEDRVLVCSPAEATGAEAPSCGTITWPGDT